MSGYGKKTQTQVSDRTARIILDKMSKAAALDLVVDLLRRCAGNETLDGAELILALDEANEPVRVARGDRPLPGYTGERVRQERRREKYEAQMVAARARSTSG